MDNKIMANKIKNIEKKERISKKLDRIFKSSIGNKITHDIGYMPMHELIIKYHLGKDFAKIKGYDQKMNLLLHAVASAGTGLHLRFNKLIDYTHLAEQEDRYDKNRAKFVEEYQKNKSPLRLTKYEQKILNKRDEWIIDRNPNGKPVIKQEKHNSNNNAESVFLYDKKSGLPIYKWKRKQKQNGLAFKLHTYELHKMKKYDRKIKPEMEVRMRSDFFPEQIKAIYDYRREEYLKKIREDLINKYSPRNPEFIVYDESDNKIKTVKYNISLKTGYIKDDKLSNNKTISSLTILHNKIQDALKPGQRITCVHMHDVIGNDERIFLPERYLLTA